MTKDMLGKNNELYMSNNTITALKSFHIQYFMSKIYE